MKQYPNRSRLPMISSAPNLSETRADLNRMDSTTMLPMMNNSASTSQIISAVHLSDRPRAQQSQQEIEAMHRVVDQTDANLRRALEQTAIRHEQLDQLQLRSNELLSKNENLVFGNITQQRERMNTLGRSQSSTT
jgi:Xaa-Pro aminopeptidase